MNSALALIQPTEYDLMAKLAKVAALSGYSQQTEVQVFFLMLKGFEIGVSPMQALDGIQVIKGKTTVSPQLMLALINRSGLLEDMKIDGDATQCTVTMQRKGRSAHTETFTIQNAQSMNLAGNHNWKAQPATMLKWRAVSACARIVFPDVIQGMYTPEEMGAEVSENSSGDIVIETPILDANFVKAENAVAQLAATNPSELIADADGVVIEDGEISNVEPPSSDAAPESLTMTPEVAKANLAGNGAPANGEKKAIGKDAGFTYDRIKMFMEVGKVAMDRPTPERNNTVIAMEGEGAFKSITSYQQGVELVLARLNSPEHGKGKKKAPAVVMDENGNARDAETLESLEF